VNQPPCARAACLQAGAAMKAIIRSRPESRPVWLGRREGLAGATIRTIETTPQAMPNIVASADSVGPQVRNTSRMRSRSDICKIRRGWPVKRKRGSALVDVREFSVFSSSKGESRVCTSFFNASFFVLGLCGCRLQGILLEPVVKVLQG